MGRSGKQDDSSWLKEGTETFEEAIETRAQVEDNPKNARYKRETVGRYKKKNEFPGGRR